MIVNVSPNDNTWQMHLIGLLAVLRQVDGCEAQPSSLLKAVHLLDSGEHIGEYLPTITMADIEKAGLVLDIAKLKLREQILEMNKLSQTVSGLRQIDLAKLRSSVKHVYRNLGLVPVMLQKHARLRNLDETISPRPKELSVSTPNTGDHSSGGYCDCKSNYVFR